MQKTVKDNFWFTIVTKLTINCHILESAHCSSPLGGLFVTVWGWGAPVVMPRLRLRDWLWLRSGPRSCVWLRSRRLHTTFTMITLGTGVSRSWPAPLSLSPGWPWQLGSVMLAFNPGSGLMAAAAGPAWPRPSPAAWFHSLSHSRASRSQPPQNTPQPQQSQSWVRKPTWPVMPMMGIGAGQTKLEAQNKIFQYSASRVIRG